MKNTNNIFSDILAIILVVLEAFYLVPILYFVRSNALSEAISDKLVAVKLMSKLQ